MKFRVYIREVVETCIEVEADTAEKAEASADRVYLEDPDAIRHQAVLERDVWAEPEE